MNEELNQRMMSAQLAEAQLPSARKRITELEQTVARLSDALQTQMQLRLKKAVNFEAALWNSGTLDVALRETASAREQVKSAVIWDEFLQAMDERGWNIQNLTP